MIKRRLFSAGLLAAPFAQSVFSGPAFAQNAQPAWQPSGPIKMVVAYPAGGPTDVIARIVAADISGPLGQQVVVENVSGGAGAIGTRAVAKAKPDGQTITFGNNQTHGNNMFMLKEPGYDAVKDFAPLAGAGAFEHVFVVRNDLPVKNIQELIALAKSKPGTLNYGSSGPGSNYHMAGELLKNIAGIDIVHVPYKGSTGARNDILSGQIQLMFDAVPTMTSTIESGMVRAIGTSGLKRSPGLPKVATLDEGGAKGFQATLWVGMMAPAGTPQAIIDILHREIQKANNNPALRETWEKQGAVPLSMAQPAFKDFMQKEVDRWAKVIADNKIQLAN